MQDCASTASHFVPSTGFDPDVEAPPDLSTGCAHGAVGSDGHTCSNGKAIFIKTSWFIKRLTFFNKTCCFIDCTVLPLFERFWNLVAPWLSKTGAKSNLVERTALNYHS